VDDDVVTGHLAVLCASQRGKSRRISSAPARSGSRAAPNRCSPAPPHIGTACAPEAPRTRGWRRAAGPPPGSVAARHVPGRSRGRAGT